MDVESIIKDELLKLLNSTKETALKDGIISADESKLIDLLELQLNAINDEIQPIADLMVDLSEEDIRSRIKIVSRDIVPKLSNLAKEDNHISPDEAAILDTFTKLIIK